MKQQAPTYELASTLSPRPHLSEENSCLASFSATPLFTNPSPRQLVVTTLLPLSSCIFVLPFPFISTYQQRRRCILSQTTQSFISQDNQPERSIRYARVIYWLKKKGESENSKNSPQSARVRRGKVAVDKILGKLYGYRCPIGLLS